MTSPALLPEETPWQDQAACQGYDTNMWFPDTAVPERLRDMRTQLARRMCRECPVQAACLNYALGLDGLYGIWGGLDLHQRSDLRRQREVR